MVYLFLELLSLSLMSEQLEPMVQQPRFLWSRQMHRVESRMLLRRLSQQLQPHNLVSSQPLTMYDSMQNKTSSELVQPHSTTVETRLGLLSIRVSSEKMEISTLQLHVHGVLLRQREAYLTIAEQVFSLIYSEQELVWYEVETNSRLEHLLVDSSQDSLLVK